MVYLAGVTSSGPAGGIPRTVDLDRRIDDGYDTARACALTQRAGLHFLGSLDGVKAIVGVNGGHQVGQMTAPNAGRRCTTNGSI
jgi:hypothetical protein